MIAIHNSDPQVRNLPVSLSPKEVADPYLAVADFFRGSNYMPHYRKRLKKYFLAALNDKTKWKRNPLINCIYCFKDIGSLLEALWLINIAGESFTPKELALRKDEEEGDVWTEDVTEQLLKGHFGEMAFHPEFITMEEEEDPYGVIRHFFKGQDLFEAKQKTDFWCRTATCNHQEYQIMDRPSLVNVFEQTCRIIEASFIILEIRELKREAARRPASDE